MDNSNMTLSQNTYTLPQVKTFSNRLNTMKERKKVKKLIIGTDSNSKISSNQHPYAISQLPTDINEINSLTLTSNENNYYSKLYNTEEVRDLVNDLAQSKQISINRQTEFGKTKYSDKNSHKVFYNKLHKSFEFFRKGLSGINSPSFNFILNAQKGGIAPNPVAIVKRKGEESKVEAENKLLGDNYIKCLLNSLNVSDHISHINFCNNRLTDFSICPLMQTIENNKLLLNRLALLDLSYNKFFNEASDSLVKYISNPDCSLEYFNIEGNLLGNNNINKIVVSIYSYLDSKIRYVNIGSNNFDDECASDLATLVKKCEYLIVLILYQNQLKNFGASLIMSEIKKHMRLKILDLSWNLIGTNLHEEDPKIEELRELFKDKEGSYNNAMLNEMLDSMKFRKVGSLPSVKKKQESLFCKELCEMFHNPDCQLLHLDLSYNNINTIDAEKISEHIKDNHTILGIHVDGNDMYVDELGFVYPVCKELYEPNHFAASQIFYRIGKNHPLIKSKMINIKKIRGKNNCWICEGWKEIKFHYKPHNSELDPSSLSVKLHLNFEGYKPFDTVFRQDSFVCQRMCPPGNLNFYFTMNGVPVKNYGNMTHELKEAINHIQMPNEDEDGENDDDIEKEPKEYAITTVAQTFVDINPEVINPNTFAKMIKFCEPRPEKKLNKKKRPRTPWTFPISIWAYYGYNYEGETEETMNNAFEFDFNRCDFGRDKDLNDTQLEELRKILKERYNKMFDTYRNLASYLGWKIWQIGQNQITEFASNCPGLLDQKYLINDVLVKVTEVKSNIIDKEERKKNQNVPDNIIRHQWMSLLVKISKDKYFRTKLKTSIPESVNYSFENHFNPYINQFDNHKWRKERYYNEYVDNVIKAHIPIFEAVFKSWAPQKIIGKDSNWMWLEEFTNMVSLIIDTDFPVKEIPTIFNLSFRVQTDEITKDYHYNMRFPEFLEAFSRFVDKLSPIPPGDNKSDWNMQQRIEQPLSTKIENILPDMMKLIKSPEMRNVRDKFPLPQKDEETGLFIIDYNCPFYGKLIPLPQRLKKKKTAIIGS